MYVCMCVCMHLFNYFGGGGIFFLRFSFLFLLAMLGFLKYLVCSGAFLWVLVGCLGLFIL